MQITSVSWLLGILIRFLSAQAGGYQIGLIEAVGSVLFQISVPLSKLSLMKGLILDSNYPIIAVWEQESRIKIICTYIHKQKPLFMVIRVFLTGVYVRGTGVFFVGIYAGLIVCYAISNLFTLIVYSKSNLPNKSAG